MVDTTKGIVPITKGMVATAKGRKVCFEGYGSY